MFGTILGGRSIFPHNTANAVDDQLSIISANHEFRSSKLLMEDDAVMGCGLHPTCDSIVHALNQGPVGMTDNIRTVLQRLVIDIEAMYRGAEEVAETGDTEEFFGPFSFSRLTGSYYDAGMEISWPNLAISLRSAKAALKKST